MRIKKLLQERRTKRDVTRLALALNDTKGDPEEEVFHAAGESQHPVLKEMLARHPRTPQSILHEIYQGARRDGDETLRKTSGRNPALDGEDLLDYVRTASLMDINTILARSAPLPPEVLTHLIEEVTKEDENVHSGTSFLLRRDDLQDHHWRLLTERGAPWITNVRNYRSRCPLEIMETTNLRWYTEDVIKERYDGDPDQETLLGLAGNWMGTLGELRQAARVI